MLTGVVSVGAFAVKGRARLLTSLLAVIPLQRPPETRLRLGREGGGCPQESFLFSPTYSSHTASFVGGNLLVIRVFMLGLARVPAVPKNISLLFLPVNTPIELFWPCFARVSSPVHCAGYAPTGLFQDPSCLVVRAALGEQRVELC